MNGMVGWTATMALLSVPSLTGADARMPQEMATALTNAEEAVEEARFCLARDRPESSEFYPLYQRSAEVLNRVRSLWGRQAIIEAKVDPRPDCKNIPAKLALAEGRIDALAQSFAIHSAPFNTGVWIGTMPLCGAGPVETRQSVDEYSGEQVLQITLAKADTASLAALTTANVGNRLAVRVDGKLVMEPHINEPILGGSIQVMAPRDDLNRLAELLKRCPAAPLRTAE